MAPEISLIITRGKTFEFAYRCAEDELLYRSITAMPVKAPVQLTVASHGVPDGWPVQVSCVKAGVFLSLRSFLRAFCMAACSVRA